MSYEVEWVRCCDSTKNLNLIYLSDENDFRLSNYDYVIDYCPWCGKLLDTNLIES